MIALFSCEEIEDNEWWLSDELDLECWNDEHIWYILRISIPSLLLWGLGFPAV